MIFRLFSLFLDKIYQFPYQIKYKYYHSKYNIHKSFIFNGNGIILYGNGEINISQTLTSADIHIFKVQKKIKFLLERMSQFLIVYLFIHRLMFQIKISVSKEVINSKLKMATLKLETFVG